jgi:hypothetical protein
MPFKLKYITFLLVLMGCIDPFDPDFSDTPQQSLLVVDGLITNENISQQITLSRSIPISVNTGFCRETGAVVTIKDDENNCHQLNQEREGFY